MRRRRRAGGACLLAVARPRDRGVGAFADVRRCSAPTDLDGRGVRRSSPVFVLDASPGSRCPSGAAFVGFVLGVLRLHPVTLRRAAPADGAVPALRARTAILMPIYNEDPDRVFAAARGDLRSLEATGAARRLRLLRAERHAPTPRSARRGGAGLVERCRAARRASGTPVLPPARRQHRHARPATSPIGRSAGAAPTTHMVVLDADSVMSGETWCAGRADGGATRSAGIIQTHAVPRRPRDAVRPRCSSSPPRCTAPVLAAGHSFWQLRRGQLLGPQRDHPRRAPSPSYCRLPVLSGPAAARRRDPEPRLRRGGADAPRRLARAGCCPSCAAATRKCRPTCSTTPRATAAGCRATCSTPRLLGARGLHWMSRLHLAMGIMAYLASPLWLLMLLLSSGLVVDHALTGARLFRRERAASSRSGRRSAGRRSTGCSTLTGALLFVPEAAGAGAAPLVAAQRRPLRRPGRPGRELRWARSLFSTLLAPVMMLFHTTFVLRILAGNAVGWPAAAARRSRDALEGGAATPHPACPARCRRPWSRSDF